MKTVPPGKAKAGSVARAFQIFRATPPRRRFFVLGCLIVSSLAEGLGLASLIPVLSLAFGADADRSGLSEFVTSLLSSVGLPVDIRSFLLVAVCLLIVKAALTLFALSQVGYAVAELTTRLRLSLISSLFAARWGYFGRQPVGRYATAIGGDSFRAGDAFLAVATTLAALFQTIISLALAMLVSWQLCLASLAVGSIVVLSLNKLVRAARQAGKRQTQRTRRLVSRLTDALIGIKPLKAMARHVRFGDLFAVDVRELNEALRRQVFYRQATRSLQEPLGAVLLGASFYLAYELWRLPMAELLVMGVLMFRAVNAIGKVQQSYISVSIAETAYFSVQDAIDEATREREIMTGDKAPTLRAGCAFHGVSFSFGPKTVLRDVSLFIPAGRVTAITGASGAGKTTIADLLLGLHRPDQGEVRIDDVPLTEIDLERWRGMVGYVPQEVILFHDTVLRNVTLGEPTLTPADAEAALRAAGALDFVSSLADGLQSVVGERGTLISGGQRQRVAIARALVHRPQLLILDEATSALDPETEAAICQNLKRLSESSGLTILAISHQPAWVETAERVYRVARHEVTLVRDLVPEALAS